MDKIAKKLPLLDQEFLRKSLAPVDIQERRRFEELLIRYDFLTEAEVIALIDERVGAATPDIITQVTNITNITEEDDDVDCYWVKEGNNIVYKDGNVGVGVHPYDNDLEVRGNVLVEAIEEEPYIEIRNWSATEYDTYVKWSSGATPTDKFIMGVDDSDSDKWMLCTGGILDKTGAAAGSYSTGTYVTKILTTEGVSLSRCHVMITSGATPTFGLVMGNTDGSGDNQFSEPQGICSDGTYIYVADLANGRIKKHVLATGAYVCKTSSSGTFNYAGPYSIVTDGTYVYFWTQSTSPAAKRYIVKLNCLDLSYVSSLNCTDDPDFSNNGIARMALHNGVIYTEAYGGATYRAYRISTATMTVIEKYYDHDSEPHMAGKIGYGWFYLDGYIYGLFVDGTTPKVYKFHAASWTFSAEFDISAGIQHSVAGMAFDGTYVYVTDGNGGGVGDGCHLARFTFPGFVFVDRMGNYGSGSTEFSGLTKLGCVIVWETQTVTASHYPLLVADQSAGWVDTYPVHRFRGQIELMEDGVTDATDYVKLAAPTAITTSYTLTFPAALPAGAAHIACSAAGVLSFGQDVGTTGTPTFVSATLDQGALDTAILLMQSSDVAHGMTTLEETDTFGSFVKAAAATGGLKIRGLTEATSALQLSGMGVTDNTTKSTSGRAYVEIYGHKKSGTTAADPGANANIFGIFKSTAPTCLWLCDVEGDTWQAGTMTANAVAVTSTTVVTNLNADQLDGYHYNTVPINTTQVLLPTGYGTPSYDDVQDFFQETRSAGRITGGVVAATAPADGTVTVTAMEGMVFTTNALGGSYIFFKMAAASAIALTDNSVNWVYFDYNAGTPRYLATTDRTTINQYNQFSVGRVYRAGTAVSVQATGHSLYNKDRRSHNRLIQKYGNMDRESGGVVSDAGTLHLAVSAGTWWVANTTFTTAAIDTTGAGRFYMVYRSGASTWTTGAAVATAPVTQYNRLSDNSLQDLTGSHYGVYWVYLTPDNVLYLIYGQSSYTNIGLAQAAAIPSSIPPFCISWARLIGKVIFQKSAATFYSVETVFTTTFSVSTAVDHGSLYGLSDDDHTQYAWCHISATDPPGVDDDVTLYREGTIWIEQDADKCYICVDNADGAAVWQEVGAGGAAGAFLDLTDVTEANYTGHAAQFVVVNGAETGLEFSASSVAGHAMLSASHTDSTAGAVVAGDIIYGDDTPKWTRLPHGNNGDVLTLAAGLPSWAAPTGGSSHVLLSATHTDTLADTVVRGDILYGNATPKWARLAKGTSGYVLSMGADEPSWTLVPTHASRHLSGGADAIKLDDLAAPDDNTDLNFSTSLHGLVPKGTVGTNKDKWLCGDGTWSYINSLFGRKIAGRYYCGGFGGATLTTASFGADYLRLIPFVVTKATTFDRIGIGISAGHAAGRYMRLGIYANDSTEYAYPGALILDSGAIEVTSSTYWEVNISQLLTPGLYWLAFLNSYAFTIRLVSCSTGPIGYILGAPDGVTGQDAYLTVSQAYGALPDPCTAGAAPSTAGDYYPNVVLRAA